jgi:hypothetical protein
MSKKEQVEIVKPAVGQQMPDFLREEKPVGLEDAKQFIVHQRLQILQALSDKPLVDAHGVGAVLLSPSKMVVAEIELDDRNRPTDFSRPFIFTPIFFFPAWGQRNDVKLKGKEPMFINYTTDPTTPIAVKARNKETREEVNPKYPDMKIYNTEILNFIILIEDERFREQLIIMNFSKAEWMTGSNFLSRIKSTNASIFARRWQARSGLRTRNGNRWFGFEIVEPDDGSCWISDKSTADQYRTLWTECAKTAKESIIKPEGLEDEAETEAAAAPSAPAAQY